MCFCDVHSLNGTMTLTMGFSWPSTVPCWNAWSASPKFMFTGLAPSTRKVSMNSGEPTTRILRLERSSGFRIGRLLLVSSRSPFSPHAGGTTPLASISLKIFWPGSVQFLHLGRPVDRGAEGEIGDALIEEHEL